MASALPRHRPPSPRPRVTGSTWRPFAFACALLAPALLAWSAPAAAATVAEESARVAAATGCRGGTMAEGRWRCQPDPASGLELVVERSGGRVVVRMHWVEPLLDAPARAEDPADAARWIRALGALYLRGQEEAIATAFGGRGRRAFQRDGSRADVAVQAGISTIDRRASFTLAPRPAPPPPPPTVRPSA
jgi:hypothetical protein